MWLKKAPKRIVRRDSLARALLGSSRGGGGGGETFIRADSSSSDTVVHPILMEKSCLRTATRGFLRSWAVSCRFLSALSGLFWGMNKGRVLHSLL